MPLCGCGRFATTPARTAGKARQRNRSCESKTYACDDRGERQINAEGTVTKPNNCLCPIAPQPDPGCRIALEPKGVAGDADSPSVVRKRPQPETTFRPASARETERNANQ